MITVDRSKLYEYHESFGTTGEPVTTWLTKSDFEQYVNQIDETPVRIRDDDIVMIRYPYALSTPAHLFTEVIRKRGGCTVPVSKATVITPFPRVVNIIKKLKVSILCCMPQEAFLIHAVAKEMGIKLDSIRALFVAGEVLSYERKRRLEERWGAPVYEFYGTSEVGNMATSCLEGNLHCSTNHFIFEVLDTLTNEKINEGRGILHVTTLSKENFPLVRFNTGDMVEIIHNKCSCGNYLPKLIHHGRVDDCLIYEGLLITQRDIEEEIYKLPGQMFSDFYCVIEKRNKIEIQLECKAFDNVQLLKKVKSELNLAIPFDLKLLPFGEIQNINKLINFEHYGKPSYIVKRERIEDEAK